MTTNTNVRLVNLGNIIVATVPGKRGYLLLFNDAEGCQDVW